MEKHTGGEPVVSSFATSELSERALEWELGVPCLVLVLISQLLGLWTGADLGLGMSGLQPGPRPKKPLICLSSPRQPMKIYIQPHSTRPKNPLHYFQPPSPLNCFWILHWVWDQREVSELRKEKQKQVQGKGLMEAIVASAGCVKLVLKELNARVMPRSQAKPSRCPVGRRKFTLKGKCPNVYPTHQRIWIHIGMRVLLHTHTHIPMCIQRTREFGGPVQKKLQMETKTQVLYFEKIHLC